MIQYDDEDLNLELVIVEKSKTRLERLKELSVILDGILEKIKQRKEREII